MTAIAFSQDIDTTTVYTIDEINVVGFYRTDTKVGNVLDRDFIAKTNKGQEPSFILSNMPSVFSNSAVPRAILRTVQHKMRRSKI